MRFCELLSDIEVMDKGGDLCAVLEGIAYDSRNAGPNYLFVAVTGFNTDGHGFLRQAIQQGATAAIIERQVELPEGIAWAQVRDSRLALARLSARFYDNPARKLRLVGVTGTNGKTTTTNLIAAIGEAAFMKVGLIGTIHNRIGHRIISGSHTTPESTDLQRLLK